MSASTPLSGNTLISCAKANAAYGIEVAAEQCGFGRDFDKFRQALQQACEQIGIEPMELGELDSKSQVEKRSEGVEISPDTYKQL